MDSHSSRVRIATHFKQPTRVQREPRNSLRFCNRKQEHLFGLALSGVYLAACVTTCAVRSYRTISPLLPIHSNNGKCGLTGAKPIQSRIKPALKKAAVSFCCTGRRLTPPRCYLALCSMEPGLSSPFHKAATAQLARTQSTKLAQRSKAKFVFNKLTSAFKNIQH